MHCAAGWVAWSGGSSGAGPSMAAFCKGTADARRVAGAMFEAAAGQRPAAEALILRPRRDGAELITPR